MFTRIAALILSVFPWIAVGVSAQTQQTVPPQGQTQAAPPKPESIIANFKKTVGLLHTAFIKDGKEMIESGTLFVVAYPDPRIGEGSSFGYLVTNRHMVEPGIENGHPYQVTWRTVRLNQRAPGADSADEVLPVGQTYHWYFPADDSVDLAVFPFLPDPAKYDILAIPLSILATRDVVAKQTITEGDRVVFAGYFYQFPGLKKFEPIVREGIIAMLPSENMYTTLRMQGHIYLADVHVFGGNSGSPILVELGGLRVGRLILGDDYRLLGVISGYYHEDADLTLTVATTVTGKLEENSGIALVVPADELKALLDSPALQAQRDAFVSAGKPAK